MFRNVVWSETAESCLNKTTNNDAYGADHGLRTPNEGINQRNLKIWATDKRTDVWSRDFII